MGDSDIYVVASRCSRCSVHLRLVCIIILYHRNKANPEASGPYATVRKLESPLADAGACQRMGAGMPTDEMALSGLLGQMHSTRFRAYMRLGAAARRPNKQQLAEFVTRPSWQEPK